MRRADLSLTVSQRKLACVLDPALVLGHRQGPSLARRLVQVMEPWLPRSFWQLIDASELLVRNAAVVDRRADGGSRLLPDVDALATWIQWRDGTDAGSWMFRWVGDNFAESQVQDAAGSEVIERYEALCEALLRRCTAEPVRSAGWVGSFDLLHSALDTVALSATLDGALVLSQAAGPREDDPWPVNALRQFQVPATALHPVPEHSLFAAERAWLRQAMAVAGLATLAQSLPPLAAIHVLAEATSPADCGADGAGRCDPWRGAKAWWYFV